MSEVGEHGDWVRDVAWCDNTALGYSMVASCSEDQTCKVWSFHEKKGKWMPTDI